MQGYDAQHTPGQLPGAVLLCPGLGTRDQQQGSATKQQGRWQAKLNRQVQGQVVRIVQNIAKTCARVERDEVRIIKFAPAPAEPRLQTDQVQHIAPHDQAALAHQLGVLQPRQNPVFTEAQAGQQGQQTGRTQVRQGGSHKQLAHLRACR